MIFNKRNQSVTITEDRYREILGILRDEKQWGNYVKIIKNHDGTRTIELKNKVDPLEVLGMLGVA